MCLFISFIKRVLFGLFEFGLDLGLGILNLASALCRPQGSGLDLNLGIEYLASFNISGHTLVSSWEFCDQTAGLVGRFVQRESRLVPVIPSQMTSSQSNLSFLVSYSREHHTVYKGVS